MQNLIDRDKLVAELNEVKEQRAEFKRYQSQLRQKEYRIKKLLNDLDQLELELCVDDSK